ncbi:DUF1569 domain-containing protein [Muricauda sp. 334s03]|uniref:DUF1569 domain-containing protein n=1 Tax=Flagellimonas yonaguniensis TaxID=3031325 RepID=A0ABT5Y319_9FLAO|nr:DUF1569 domain-containing protein [[Muricauda] yonaguniensis]MDF0717847.1 DUF1569 domain-containing protein [[Muricauda] yonaguniensis]
MKSLFNSEAHEEILSRINQLSESSERQWGKMEIGQMLHHCQFPLKISLRKHRLDKPSPMLKFMGKFFKKSLYNDKPWRQGLPTAKGLKVVDDKNFDEEKKALISLIKDFHQEKDKKEWDPHPVFGSFTPEQWGQMQYKHLDHHLRQFGV